MKIRVGSLLDLSTIDWPNHITLMLFCSGCNFHCPFCMNATLIPADSGGEIGIELIEGRVLGNIGFVDAIGATGGEPGLQPEPVIALFRWAKKKTVKTFLNTNGSNPQLIEQLLAENLLDHVAIDVKAPLRPEAYSRVIGLSRGVEGIVANVRQSLELCRKAGLSVEVRTTVVPTLIEDEKSIREIIRVARDCSTYVLQQYFPFEEVPDEKLRRVKPPGRDALVKLARVSLEEGAGEVYIRTRENGMERIK
ncbi:MAG: anaerobic ribonucleoside-triphosphate reductase activating protein [Candidatus Bathyarchaeota archaeon]